jgi:CheY-like chemotaxis protein
LLISGDSLTTNSAQLTLVWLARICLTVRDSRAHCLSKLSNPAVAGNSMTREQQSQPAAPNQNEGMDLKQGPSKPCVLLVEDDRSVRRYLEVTLLRSGYDVVTAEDGLEAMKLALSSQCDLVVTDAVMPNLSGQELARFLRNNQKLSHLPIVLLTGQENKESSATAENLIDAFLYKPVKARELTNCLAGLLQKGQSLNQDNLGTS